MNIEITAGWELLHYSSRILNFLITLRRTVNGIRAISPCEKNELKQHIIETVIDFVDKKVHDGCLE